MFKRRLKIGLIEPLLLENKKTYKAKIDTGADSSSIDIELAKKLGDKQITGHKTIRSALGRHKRPTIVLEVEFQGRKFSERFTLSDRSGLKYKVLIGKDILKKEEFLVDPCKN